MKNVHLTINVSLLRTTAEVHHHDTAEDHEGGKNLLPTEGVHAETDTDGGGDDGLHVGIHADQGRTDALLPYRDKEIGDKSGTNDEISKLGKEGARESCIVDGSDLVSGKGKRHEGGEKEYPLHERDHWIARNERFEYTQVERETEAIGYDEQDANEARLTRSIGDTDTIENEENDSEKTDGHTACFAQGNRFFQSKSGNKHRQDGRNGAHDGAIHGSDVWDSDKESNLREEKAKHRGKEYLQKILPLDFLTRSKQGDKPKEQPCTDGAQAKECHRGNEMAARQVFTDDDVDAKDRVCDEACQVAKKFGVHEIKQTLQTLPLTPPKGWE